MIKILLVDDHKIFTEGVASLLLHEPDFEVVGECQKVEQVKDFLKRIAIDVILLDINLGGESGLDVCKFVVEHNPSIKILAVSMYNDESFITRMMKNGASGYTREST